MSTPITQMEARSYACETCGRVIEAVANTAREKAAATAAPPKVPLAGSLSVRAYGAISRYRNRNSLDPLTPDTPLTVLAGVSLRTLASQPEVGPKALLELRDAAVKAGVQMTGEEVLRPPRVPAAVWTVDHARVNDGMLELTLRADTGGNLKILRPATEAPVLYPGRRIRVDLVPIDDTVTPEEPTP